MPGDARAVIPEYRVVNQGPWVLNRGSWIEIVHRRQTEGRWKGNSG